MIPPACQKKTNERKVKVEEYRKKAVFLNEARSEFVITRVDGCVIKDGVRSDWVVTRLAIGDVIVELKGVDVGHGLKQVRATADYWKAKQLLEGKLAALIVCAQYPKISTEIQRAQAALAKDYRAPLHVVARNAEYLFENVLSFKGPFKK